MTTTMTEVKLYKTTFKSLKILLMAIPFIVIGIWEIYTEPLGSFDSIIAIICTGFFGLGIPMGLFHLFDKRAQIIINEDGIWDRTTNQEKIKWEQIKRAYPLNIYGQKFVSLVTDNTFVFKQKQLEWAAKISKNVGAQKLNLQLSQLKIDEKQMTSFLQEMIMAEKPNRTSIINKYFGN